MNPQTVITLAIGTTIILENKNVKDIIPKLYKITGKINNWIIVITSELYMI